MNCETTIIDRRSKSTATDRRYGRVFAVSLMSLATSSSLLAQDGPRSMDLPNPMGLHTWFIIGAVGAFLSWCISYTIHVHKEALERQKGRGDLLARKDDLLNKIVDLENRKDRGQISDQHFKNEMKELRFHLGKVLERIADPEAQKSAKKTS